MILRPKQLHILHTIYQFHKKKSGIPYQGRRYLCRRQSIIENMNQRNILTLKRMNLLKKTPLSIHDVYYMQEINVSVVSFLEREFIEK